MTTKSDIKAITLTANASAAGKVKGRSMEGLIAQAIVKTDELRIVLAQIIADTPGGDANLTSLNNILAALA